MGVSRRDAGRARAWACVWGMECSVVLDSWMLVGFARVRLCARRTRRYPRCLVCALWGAGVKSLKPTN